jgi:hypothetical protein
MLLRTIEAPKMPEKPAETDKRLGEDCMNIATWRDSAIDPKPLRH